MASKVSAFESLRVLTLPDVRVALWIELEIEPTLLLENGWKPRVVAPVGFYDHCIVWLLLAQKFVNGVLLPAWVPVGPQFRSFLSDRGAQQCQTASTQRLRFLHPRDIASEGWSGSTATELCARYAKHICAIGGGRTTSFASLRRFCAIAASVN